jgi:hypothetical protein
MCHLPTGFSMSITESAASSDAGSSFAASQSRMQSSSNMSGRTDREIAEMISLLVLRRQCSSKVALTRAGSKHGS